MRSILKRKSSIHLKFAEDLIVMGDSKRIHQVFYYTIDNTIKYPLFASTISINLEKFYNTVQYQIDNDGMDILEENIERIGERFFQTDKARNRTTGGTGLGLSIVKEIVRLHDGLFTINSDKKMGTTVTIQLPYVNIEGVD